MKYRKDINGLRGLAVSLVIIYHYNNYYLRAGYIGVDIFFLISGYIMMLVYHNRYKSKILLSLTFYSNRIKKILPISNIVLLYILLNILKFKDYNPYDIQIDVRYAIFGISNIRFYYKNVDYMYESQPPSVILHFWSLSIEEQFYFIFPLLLFLNKLIIYFIFVISLTYSIIISNKYYNLAYFMLNVRLWEFIFGIILFINQINMHLDLNYISLIGIVLLLLFISELLSFNTISIFGSYFL